MSFHPGTDNYTCNDISWQQCSISIPLISMAISALPMNAWDVFQSNEIKFMEDTHHNNSKFAYFLKFCQIQ